MTATLTPPAASNVDSPVACGTCAHRDEHSWWGPGISHCSDCHRSWNRTSKQAHCRTCCGHFASPAVFDSHLNPEGCKGQDLADVTKRDGSPRFRVRDLGIGPVWYHAYDGDRPGHWDDDTA